MQWVGVPRHWAAGWPGEGEPRATAEGVTELPEGHGTERGDLRATLGKGREQKKKSRDLILFKHVQTFYTYHFLVIWFFPKPSNNFQIYQSLVGPKDFWITRDLESPGNGFGTFHFLWMFDSLVPGAKDFLSKA